MDPTQLDLDLTPQSNVSTKAEESPFSAHAHRLKTTPVESPKFALIPKKHHQSSNKPKNFSEGCK